MLHPPTNQDRATFATHEARSSRLERAALAFCGMLTAEEVATKLLDFLMEVPTAYAGIVALIDGEELRSIHLRGYPEVIAAKMDTISFATLLPVVDAGLTGRPVFIFC